MIFAALCFPFVFVCISVTMPVKNNLNPAKTPIFPNCFREAKNMTKENGKVKNFNVKKFIIAMLIAAIVCVSVLSVLFGIDKTFSSGESITVSLIEAGNIR